MYLNIAYDKTRKMGILDSDYFDIIKEHFSVKDNSASIKKMYNHHIPTRKYAITASGRFAPGLLSEILNYCKTFTTPINLNVSDDFKQYFKPSYSIENIALSALKLDLRDYQTESIRKCLKQGRGVLKLATGSGKTLLMAALIKTIHDNIPNHFTVIIVPSVQLVEQTYKDFLGYGLSSHDICRVSGNHELEMGKPIIIIGSQFLLTGKNVSNLLFSSNLLVVDEVHGLRKDNKLNKVIDKFYTPHKFGLTGTLPDDQIDIWNIIGKIGPIVYEKDSHELRSEGYLSEVEVLILRLHYQTGPSYTIPSLSDPLVAFNEEREFLTKNPFRNLLISKIATRTVNNTLIVVDRLVHGEILKTAITESAKDKKVYFIKGEVEVEDREYIRDLMEKENNIVVIAMAKIFATGINIKNLHYIILGVSGKAGVRLVQSIGRGLRLLESKEKLVVLDISDQLKYGKDHEEIRRKIYQKEKITYSFKDYYE